MTTRTLNNQDGIALGPILFIIAILAIIAAAIAAGSGSFTANSNTESAKAMAETIITSCDDYQRAVQIVTMQNGCDPTALDWTPNGGGYPTGVTTWNGGDWTYGNGTNRAGNGQCAVFDPRGGGMIYKNFPPRRSPHRGQEPTRQKTMEASTKMPWPVIPSFLGRLT